MTEAQDHGPKIISVTGTKGKTTVVRLLDSAYRTTKRPTLLVDTHGHYLDGKRKSTLKDGVKLYDLVPSVCPGRFLYELKDKNNSVAILEMSIGSSALPGMGYRAHDIGVLTNIFEDHIGSRLKSRRALAREKGRLFARVKLDGALVFNADDVLVVEQLKKVKSETERNLTLIPVGLDFSAFDLDDHLSRGGKAITWKDHKVLVLTKEGQTKLFETNKISWIFEGYYLPSVYNLLFAVACIFVEQGQKRIPKLMQEALINYSADEKKEGRLLRYKYKKKNVDIIVDYAHEKFSLKAIGNLASHISKRKTIGVIRFAVDRTDKQLRNYSREIANVFDTVVVYDKVDGVTRQPLKDLRKKWHRDVGEVSAIVFDEIKKHTSKQNSVYRVIPENKALEKALSLSEEGDVIVHIFGNDSNYTLKVLKNLIK